MNVCRYAYTHMYIRFTKTRVLTQAHTFISYYQLGDQLIAIDGKAVIDVLRYPNIHHVYIYIYIYIYILI